MKNNITINNDKGRLTQAEIDRMIEEAKKFKAEDSAQQEKTQARQELENYCYQVKEALTTQNLMSKLNDEEQEEMERHCADALEWIEHNEECEKHQFAGKKRELETTLKPLFTKMYAVPSGAEKKKKAAGRR